MKDAKERILDAALKEFASEGFKGARVDKIATDAGINKAMIFYYFSSKKNLYVEVLNHVMSEIFGRIAGLIAIAEHPATFLERMPKIYISFLAENRDFIRMTALALIQNPEDIQNFFKRFFSEKFAKGPGLLMQKVSSWYQKGEISEPDPLQFMINIISLSIFIFIGQPILEAMFNINIDEIDDFYKNRIQSVVNLLKKGMLK